MPSFGTIYRTTLLNSNTQLLRFSYACSYNGQVEIMQDYRDESNTDKKMQSNFTMELINAIDDQLQKNIFRGKFLCNS